MGRHKVPLKRRLDDYTHEFGRHVLKSDGKALFCIVCDHGINNPEARCNVIHHLNSATHQENAKRPNRDSQPFMGDALQNAGQSKETRYRRELCRALVETDIPFTKLDHPEFRTFLEKWTSQKTPDESTLRKNYLPRQYEERIQELQQLFAGKHIWVGMDELCDKSKRSVGAVVVGRLDSNGWEAPYVIHLVELEHVNHATMAALLNDALRVFKF